jgi:hypothetical protein
MDRNFLVDNMAHVTPAHPFATAGSLPLLLSVQQSSVAIRRAS